MTEPAKSASGHVRSDPERRSSRTPQTDRMPCAMCGRTKAWPEGFPTRFEAICWQCRWEDHQAEMHPPKRRWRWRSPLYRIEVPRG